MIRWKIANRWGWFLTAGTILTTLSLVPVVVEDRSVGWIEWFGALGGLSMILFRPTSSAGFIAAAAVGFFLNIFALAAIIELVLRGIRHMRRPSVGRSETPAA